MASQNIARLGVVFGVDTAELETKISSAKKQFKEFGNQVARDSQNAAKDLVQLRYATEDYGKTLTKVQMIEREIQAGRYQKAEKSLTDMLLKEAAAYDAKAASMKRVTGEMTEQQKIQLGYQTTDLFTQIASGQSPLIALIQQGGQLKDVMGGLGNMFKAIGQVLTPMRLLLGGVAGALGTVAYAAYSGRDEFDKLKDTLTLTGNYAGITTEKFYKLSDELSNRTHASLGMTKDALNAVVASGKFTETSISAVTQSVITYAQIAGVDAKTAAEKLTSGLDGTASGARSLNKEMNFLTLEQYKQIEALEKAGKRQEAAKVAAIALNTQLAAQRRELGTLEKAWESLTNGLSGFWNMLKDIGKPETTDQVISQLDRQIKAVQDALGKNTGGSKFEQEQKKQLQALKDQREALLETERLKARSIAARDVGNAKQEIEDRAGAGGMDKEKQIIAATEKVRAEIRYTQALKSANEIQKIDLDAAKQVSEKRAEFNAKSDEEKRAMGGLLARQLAAEELLIEEKKLEKIRLIREKNRLSELDEYLRTQKEITDAEVAEDNRLAAIRTSNQSKTKDMEYQRESLELKNQMIYATEKEQRLAEISLEYARKRKEVEEGPDKQFNLQQIERQEQMAKMFVTIEDSTKRTQQVFDSVWGNMSSAIDNFVKTGKLSMKDFARSVIQDLIAIQMKAQAIAILRMMFGASAMSSSSYNLSGGIAEHVFNPAGRASGGAVSPNTPYIVGEKGPELFMPSGSGTIVPNNKMGSTGGTTNVTNNYINAIDTKSFEDRLLGSSNAIWAANAYASKSLAVNRGRA